MATQEGGHGSGFRAPLVPILAPAPFALLGVALALALAAYSVSVRVPERRVTIRRGIRPWVRTVEMRTGDWSRADVRIVRNKNGGVSFKTTASTFGDRSLLLLYYSGRNPTEGLVGALRRMDVPLALEPLSTGHAPDWLDPLLIRR